MLAYHQHRCTSDNLGEKRASYSFGHQQAGRQMLIDPLVGDFEALTFKLDSAIIETVTGVSPLMAAREATTANNLARGR